MLKLPFRIGTTSYIWPDDILPNVVQLVPLVNDVELVLFESDEYGSNLPSEAVIAELRQLARGHDLTMTVHLPLDLRLGDDGAARDVSLEKARLVIERTRALDPFAYIVHLDGKAIQNIPLPDPPVATDGEKVWEPRPYPFIGPFQAAEGKEAATLEKWQAQAARSLEQVVGWAGDVHRLCVENLENYDPAALVPVLERVPVSRCVDVGHFWLQGRDPLPHLSQWQARTRVVHLHGVGERDHQSLATITPAALDPVVAHLLGNMCGVVTLEVFSVDDLFSSLSSLEAAVKRCWQAKC